MARLALAKEPIFDSVGYHPHSGQKLIHQARERHRVAACGRRFGKSHAGGHELVVEALHTYTMLKALEEKGVRREFWIVGPEYSDAEKEFRVLYNAATKLEMPFDHPGTYNNPEAGSMSMSLWGGKFKVHAMSAKYPSTLVGEGLSGVIMAEAAKIKENVWVKYIRPTLADFRGWSLHTSTPEGKNWFYRNYQRGLNPAEPNWAGWRMPSWKNDVVFPGGGSHDLVQAFRELQKDPNVTLTPQMVADIGVDEEIVDMMGDMSEEKFKQEVEADFTEFVGRVFKDFDEEIHVKDLEYDPRYPLYACCDYGWTNPFVWLFVQVDVFDHVTVLGEYRVQNRDINDIAADLESLSLISKVVRFYPDPASPGDTAVLEKKLKIQSGGHTGGELRHRLEQIRQRLRLFPNHGPMSMRKPRILIDRSCTGLIREMQEYRYPDTKEEALSNAKEEPLKKDDHGPEALGRFFAGFYGAIPDGERGRAKVSKAKVGR